jgi:predicted  nucleic acid-binding Zn-ribbon protein
MTAVTDVSIAELIGGGLAGVLALVFTLQKLMTFWKKESADQANADAVTSQFKALQDSIDQHTKELGTLRATVMQMDGTIHKQQRKLTRLEMVVIRMESLMQRAGAEVPEDLRREIDDLVRAQE